MWRMRDSGLSPHYTLVFLNNVAFNVIEFAKSQVCKIIKVQFIYLSRRSVCLTLSILIQIEWMSEKLIKAFENQKTNPFQLKSVVVCHTLLELNQIASPKVKCFTLKKFLGQIVILSLYYIIGGHHKFRGFRVRIFSRFIPLVVSRPSKLRHINSSYISRNVGSYFN